MNDIAPPHLMIVEAQIYPDIAEEMARGAVAAIESAGATYDRYPVPGSFEIPAAIRFAVEAMEEVRDAPQFDGYVALGCVIRGETDQYGIMCAEAARGLSNLTLQFGLAIGYGILTVESEEQAWARARVSEGNKGATAAQACLAMVGLKTKLGMLPR